MLVIRATTNWDGLQGAGPPDFSSGRTPETVSLADPAGTAQTRELMPDPPEDSLPVAKLRQIDKVCDQFEDALQAGR